LPWAALCGYNGGEGDGVDKIATILDTRMKLLDVRSNIDFEVNRSA
jgi:hypothetical protein